MSDDFTDDWPEADDDVSETVPCPACGAEIYEEAEQCPVCGEYVVGLGRRSALTGKPAWYVLLAVVGILATIVVLSGLAGIL